MAKLSDEQLEFAAGMSAKQWAVLSMLADAPWWMSASERVDAELSALIEQKLAHCFSVAPGVFALWGWEATEAGKALIEKRRKSRAASR